MNVALVVTLPIPSHQLGGAGRGEPGPTSVLWPMARSSQVGGSVWPPELVHSGGHAPFQPSQEGASLGPRGLGWQLFRSTRQLGPGPTVTQRRRETLPTHPCCRRVEVEPLGPAQLEQPRAGPGGSRPPSRAGPSRGRQGQVPGQMTGRWRGWPTGPPHRHTGTPRELPRTMLGLWGLGTGLGAG